MPDELSPADQPEPKQEPSENPAESRSRLIRNAAVAAVCILLLLPIAYLLLHRAPQRSVLAGLPAAAPADLTVAGLEEMVHSIPTVANRLNLSLAYIHDNRPGKAIPLLDSIVAEDGNNAVAWNNLCVAHTLQMAYNIAIDDCNRAIRIEPNLELAHNNLGWATDEKRKAIAAIATREQIAPASRDAGSWLAEGLDDLHVGNYDQAIHAWQQTLRLDAKNAYAANNIGTAYMMKKQPAIAMTWFEKAASMDPAMELAKNNLAWAKDEEAKAAKTGHRSK